MGQPHAGVRLRHKLFTTAFLRRRAPGPSETAATTLQFDPAHPVPTIGGAGIACAVPAAARACRCAGIRKRDSQRRCRVGGPVEITLFASSTATDTDFTAKLLDVYPPSADFPSGFDMNLTDGIVRSSYRDHFERRQLLEPGKIYDPSFDPSTRPMWSSGVTV
jgi:predicted acyl esterase